MTVAEAVRAAAHPLTGAAEDYDLLMDLIGDARLCCSARRPMARPPAINFNFPSSPPAAQLKVRAVRIQALAVASFTFLAFTLNAAPA